MMSCVDSVARKVCSVSYMNVKKLLVLIDCTIIMIIFSETIYFAYNYFF